MSGAAKPPGGYWKTYGASLRERGWRAIRLAPGQKFTREKGWQKRGVPSAAEIAFWSVDPEAGIGLNMGLQGDDKKTVIVAIDVDIKDPTVAAAMRDYLARGGLAVTRTGLPPKFATLVRIPEEVTRFGTAKYRLPGDEPDEKGNYKGHHVEILGTGRQLVAYASHPDTGMPYTWKGGEPASLSPEYWPLLTIEDLEAIVAHATDLLVEAGGEVITRGRPTARAPRENDSDLGNKGQFAGVAALIDALGIRMKGGGRDKINFRCPFSEFHSKGEPDGCGLVDGGGIKCHHASCDGRETWDFIEAMMDQLEDGEEIFAAARDAKEAEQAESLARMEAEFEASIGGAGGEAKPEEQTEQPKAKPGGGAGAKPPPSSWPEPVDFLDDPNTGTPLLKREHLPDAIADYVFDSAERIGSDPALAAIGSLVSLSAVMAEEWAIQPKADDYRWKERARLWGIGIGPVSARKSPVTDDAVDPLERMQREAANAHAAALAEHHFATHLHEEKSKEERKGERMPPPPRLPRLVVQDTTVEGLQNVFRNDEKAEYCTPSGKILIYRDELSGWLASMDRNNPGGKSDGDRSAFILLYGGRMLSIDRVGRKHFTISAWSGCVLGNIQPELIQKIAHDAADDGLLQRFIYAVVAPMPRGVDRVPDMAALRRYEALFPALLDLWPDGEGKAGEGPGRVVTLSDEAREHRNDFLALTDAVAATPDISSRVVSTLVKWEATWARLALVYHLIDLADPATESGDKYVVGGRAAGKVTAYMRDVLVPNLIKANALMFKTAQSGWAQKIAGHILARGYVRVGARDIMNAYHELRAPNRRDEFQSVMDNLEALAWVRDATQRRRGKYGTAWLVNPAVHTVFAERARAEREARDAIIAKVQREAAGRRRG